MIDPTEPIRRAEVALINSAVESENEQAERSRLEKLYGKVWNTEELRVSFEVIGFMAPYVIARRLSDNKKMSLQFQHNPRFYFNAKEA